MIWFLLWSLLLIQIVLYVIRLLKSIYNHHINPIHMLFNQEFLDSLSAQAAASPRLRMHYDLRDSSSDGSMRMLNALEPGTVIPIHRHLSTSEE